MTRSALITVVVVAVLVLGSNHLFAQSFSASQIHQLMAKVDRLDRELARAKQELASLRRGYAGHVHPLNVKTLPAAKLRTTTSNVDELKLLARSGPGDPTLTRRPK